MARLTNDEAIQLISQLSTEFGVTPLDISFSDIPEQHPLQGLAIQTEHDPCLVILRNNPKTDTVFHEFYHCMAEQKGLPNTEYMADAFSRSITETLGIRPSFTQDDLYDILKIAAAIGVGSTLAVLITKWLNLK